MPSRRSADSGAVTIRAARWPTRTGVGGEPQAAERADRSHRRRARACRPTSWIEIFSPFFTTKPQGSGLGLAIVRKIVDAHDGRIDVSAPMAGGTRFRVTLPVKSSHELFR